ncbi:MAG: hypothetical protein KJ896_02770 [Nanoarchaeota archaeon]|nr:hypothetical protein [Nanoarchaeota archaeon]
MNFKILLFIVCVLTLILLTSCSTPSCPESCDDENSCTKDICNEETNFQCANKEISPCCGDKICEIDKKESHTTCISDCEYSFSSKSEFVNWYKSSMINEFISIGENQIDLLMMTKTGSFEYASTLAYDNKKKIQELENIFDKVAVPEGDSQEMLNHLRLEIEYFLKATELTKEYLETTDSNKLSLSNAYMDRAIEEVEKAHSYI